MENLRIFWNTILISGFWQKIAKNFGILAKNSQKFASQIPKIPHHKSCGIQSRISNAGSRSVYCVNTMRNFQGAKILWDLNKRIKCRVAIVRGNGPIKNFHFRPWTLTNKTDKTLHCLIKAEFVTMTNITCILSGPLGKESCKTAANLSGSVAFRLKKLFWNHQRHLEWEFMFRSF